MRYDIIRKIRTAAVKAVWHNTAREKIQNQKIQKRKSI